MSIRLCSLAEYVKLYLSFTSYMGNAESHLRRVQRLWWRFAVSECFFLFQLTYVVQAFDTATSHFGIPKVLEAADMVLRKVPDRLSVMTYLFQLRAYFTREQESSKSCDIDGDDSELVSDAADDTRQSVDSTSSDSQEPMLELSVSNCKCTRN